MYKGDDTISGIYDTYLTDSFERMRTVLDDSGSRPILFVGSGFSRRYLGAPDWKGLLKHLISLIPGHKMPYDYYAQNAENDLPKIASDLVELYSGYAWNVYEEQLFPRHLYDATEYGKSIFLKYQASQVVQELTEKFQIEEHLLQRELEIFKTLFPHAIITTNYDGFLEKMFEEYSVIIGQQVIKRKESTNIGHILKIHGCMTKPEEVVISAEDYAIFNEKKKYLTAKLLTYFVEHPVIFLGYSLSDPNIKAILAEISQIVSSDVDEVLTNLWFIEWQENPISPDAKPSSDRTIDLGQGKSIRVNYLLVNDYEGVYASLHQNTAAPMDALRDLQAIVYNIVKSKTVTDLEVDMLHIKNFKDERALVQTLGFKPIGEGIPQDVGRVALLGVGTVVDAEQLMARFPMRITELAERLGFTYWYKVDQMIKQVAYETGFNIKEGNNAYHVNVGIKQPEHRYSMEAITLFRKIMNKEPYELIREEERVTQ
ncbi:MAG: SIR2 family protein [Candidatus Pristimantibacillus sp.]